MSEDLFDVITADIYENFKTAIEIGKWPDGRLLTKEQLKLCMEAMIRFEKQHLPAEQHTGYMESRCKKSK